MQILHALSDVKATVWHLAPQIFDNANTDGIYQIALLEDAVTGGDFRGATRAIDLDRLSNISNQMHALNKLILKRRKSWLDRWRPW